MDRQKLFQDFMEFVGNVHANTHAMVKVARSDSVTPLQHSILEYIFFSQVVTTSQIADCLNISLPNTSREVKKLMQQNLLTKEISVDDRRKSAISLSEAGSALMAETFSKIEVNFWQQVGSLSDVEMEDICAAMNILNTIIFPASPKKL